MPKIVDEVTGEGKLDSCLTDIGHSAIRQAREMRALTHVVSGIILWSTESNDKPVPATIAKKGHHPLVRTLIEQARNYDHWNQLDKLAQGDVRQEIQGDWIPVSALDQRIKIATGKAKALESLRESCLRILSGGQAAMKQADDLIAKLVGLAQAYRIHREKQKLDVSSLDSASIEQLIAAQQVTVRIGDPNLDPNLTGEMPDE